MSDIPTRRRRLAVAVSVAMMAGTLFALAEPPTASAQLCGGLLPPCPPPPPPPECRDGFDNDGDALLDGADLGCSSSEDNAEGDDPAPDTNGNPTPGPDVDPRTTGKLFGFNTSLGDNPISGITPEQEVALIQRAGGNAHRIFGIVWKNVQPARNVFDDSSLVFIDRTYAQLVARKMRPIFHVLQAPAWASEYATCGVLDFECQERQSEADRLPPSQAEIPAYAAFVKWVAQRYPLAAIETWNEPNQLHAWNAASFPSPSRMADMQCAAYDAVKSANPDQTVLAPGFGFVHRPNTGLRQSYVDFVRAMYTAMSGRVCWDALSVHVYPNSNTDGPGTIPDTGSTADAFRVIRNLRTQYGDTTPIWVTETGASTSGREGGDHGGTQRTEAEQRSMIRGVLNELLTTPDVGAVMVHTLRDNPHLDGDTDSTQYGYGMLRNQALAEPEPKPAWCHLVGVVGNSYPGCSPP